MTDYPNFMADFGADLLSNGYSILPIIPAKKVPGTYSEQSGWREMSRWQKYGERRTMPFEHAVWKAWPGCAIGLATGEVIGVDIDILTDATLAFELESLARNMLGNTPAYRIGRAPKRALFYRSDKPFRGRKKHPLEIYGLGAQMVVYGIHPDTQQPYTWPDEGLTEIDISRLPVITEDMAMRWLNEAYNRVPLELRPKSLSAAKGIKSEWTGPSDPRGTLEAVKSALAFLPNTDVDGSSWVLMLNAIKAALGEEGRQLWLDWSTSSSKSGASGRTDTAARRWKSARPVEVGAGTIYYLAQEQGWSPDSDLILSAADAELASEVHPAAEFLAKFSALANVKRADGPMKVTSNIMGVTGILRQIVDAIVASAMSPQPFLALGAAIATVGVLAGRRYRTRTDLRTNVYEICIAGSGGGKDHARKWIKKALFEAGLHDYLGGDKIASGAAILTSLERHPSRLFLMDEFGKVVEGITAQNAQKHFVDIWTNLTELFTSASSIFLGTEYADQKARPRVDIVQPCCCVYGTTVPGSFWDALGPKSMSDGSLARFLIFQTDEDYPDDREEPDATLPSPALVAALQAVAGKGGVVGGGDDEEGSRGNLGGVMSASAILEPTPYVVGETGAAGRLLKSIRRSQKEWLRQAKGTPQTAIIARYAENVAKLALIAAISDNPVAPEMTEDHVVWAHDLVDHCVYTMLRESDRYVADNQIEADKKWVLDMIAKGGVNVSQNQISRQTQRLTRSQRDQILADLVDSGHVVMTVERKEGAGRPGKSYTANVSAEAKRMRMKDAG